MAFQSVPNTVEVVVDFVIAGTPTANTMKFQRASPYTQAQLDTLAAACDSNIGVNWPGMLNPADSYVGVRVRGLSVENDMQASSSVSSGVGTKVLGVPLPSSVSLCLTLRTAQTGRSARGRWFVQRPFDTDMQTPNTVTALYAATVVEKVNSFRVGAESNGWQCVIVSRFSNKVKRPVALTFPVTSIIARNTRVDSQRGRMPAPE